jgi:hypothetical protein
MEGGEKPQTDGQMQREYGWLELRCQLYAYVIPVA